MNNDEKLVWYIFDIHVSDPRKNASHAYQHLNACSDAELQEVEISEALAAEWATTPTTYVKAFIRCPHGWNDWYEDRMFGWTEPIRELADMLIAG
jgi:hypothetical protein